MLKTEKNWSIEKIAEIKQQEPSFLQAAKKKGYVCPVCSNGTGKNGDGIVKDNTHSPGTHYKCFRCGLYADILDLYGKANNTEDFQEKVSGAAAYYGFQADKQNNTQKREKEQDYTSFFKEAHKNIKETDYPQWRGLSEAVINRFMLGYVSEWKHPKAPNAPASPRLIIPTSKYSYLARDIRKELTDEQKKYSKSKVGEVRIFNIKSLQTAIKPIFIVEGEIDALSIIEAGGEAIAIGSTANRKSLLKVLENQKPVQPLIIAMDNDEAGSKASLELVEGLKRLEIAFCVFNPCGEKNDANDALCENKEGFEKSVAEAERICDEAKKAKLDAYEKTSTLYYLQGFIDGIADSVNTPYIPTGFKKLDETLDGGLYEGLYIIGAISSLGKTTLITQIADQIAQMETDVLIMSLEMARTEIIAKSISRHTLQSILASGGDIRATA